MKKLLLLPKVWFQGSQSTITGGRSSRKGQTSAYCSWFTVSMRWVLITPFGIPVDPEVNRIFATVSGPTRAKALLTSGPGSLACNWAIGVDLKPTESRAAPNLSASAAQTSPGRSSSKISLSLAKSLDISEYAGDTGATGTPT